jgi:hypothetical protein
MKRNTVDLIEELDGEAGNFTNAALVVGFDDRTAYVFSNDENRLTKLNDMIQSGGEPIGLFGIDMHHGLLSIHHRLLAEHAEESWAERYLEALLEGFKQQLEQAYPDAALNDKPNLEDLSLLDGPAESIAEVEENHPARELAT